MDFIITECRLFYASSVSTRFFFLSFLLFHRFFSFLLRALLPRYVAPSADIHVVVLLSFGKPTPCALHRRTFLLLFRRYLVFRGSRSRELARDAMEKLIARETQSRRMWLRAVYLGNGIPRRLVDMKIPS